MGDAGCDAGACGMFDEGAWGRTDGDEADEVLGVGVVAATGASGVAAASDEDTPDEAGSAASTSTANAAADDAEDNADEDEDAAAAAAAAAAAFPDAVGLRMIFRTPVLPPPSVFLDLGNDPSGAMFSNTPNRTSPASSKLALLCTGGSSHLFIRAREPSLLDERAASPPDPFPLRC